MSIFGDIFTNDRWVPSASHRIKRQKYTSTQIHKTDDKICVLQTVNNFGRYVNICIICFVVDGKIINASGSRPELPCLSCCGTHQCNASDQQPAALISSTTAPKERIHLSTQSQIVPPIDIKTPVARQKSNDPSYDNIQRNPSIQQRLNVIRIDHISTQLGRSNPEKESTKIDESTPSNTKEAIETVNDQTTHESRTLNSVGLNITFEPVTNDTFTKEST